MAAQRVSEEPAYVLHRYDWSESSLILEVFTRHHGRMALVAKGAKRPSSGFRPVLLPLQPLRLSFGGDAEIRTLKGAEWVGGHVMPTGGALLSGYYLNELLLVTEVMASGHSELLQSALRTFELLLLREIGLLPLLDAQTLTLGALEPDARYSLVPEGGLRQTAASDPASLSGAQWAGLQAALAGSAPFTTTLGACAAVMAELKPQLRALLNYHCGVGTLRTRQMMIDLQSL